MLNGRVECQQQTYWGPPNARCCCAQQGLEPREQADYRTRRAQSHSLSILCGGQCAVATLPGPHFHQRPQIDISAVFPVNEFPGGC